jgi:cytochrome c oxidase assembly factor CtaG/ferredoxin
VSGEVAQAAWASWSFPVLPAIALLAALLIYLRGWRAIRTTRPLLFPPWRAWCFVAGLLALWMAIASPLNALDDLLLTAHMAQHLILMSIVPPLLLLGAPAVPLLRGLPTRSLLRDGLGPFLRSQELHKLFRLITHPAFAWALMNLAYLGWHVPAAYELALRSGGWHEAEHACFLITSLLFWFPIIQPWPSVSRWSRWLLLPYLVGADLVNTAVAGFLTFAGRVVYPSYASVPRLFGMTALGDQAAAGAFMWVLGSILFLIPAAIIAVQLLSPPARRGSATTLKTGPVATRATLPLDLLQLSFPGKFLRWRYGRAVLQLIAFVVTALVIADAFRGPSMSAMNLAGVLPWTYVRAFGVIALLALGNVFCLSCPFMLPRELGHRLGLARFRWPRWLRNKWTAVALLLLFFWSYEAFAIWDHPQRTAWLLLTYFAAAFLVDTFFRGASFCKYVCPLGQFNFTASLLSPFRLQARSQAVCARCTTHDCIAGNEKQRGCELQLYMPQKVGNMDCTLCLDCVHACPHDNIGLFAIAPLPPAMGKFSSRRDISVLVLLLVVAAFANAWWMAVSAGSYWTGILALAACTAIFALTMRQIQVVALLPMGMSMWAAHLLFHLSTGWATLGPVARQAAADLGWHSLAPAHWATAAPLLGADATLSLQLLLLDAGMLITLYLGWRFAERRAILFPWAIAVVSAWAGGVWILLQPMQTRGMIMGA